MTTYQPTRMLDARIPPIVPSFSVLEAIPVTLIPFSALQADQRTFAPTLSGPLVGYTCETGMGSTNNDGGESSDGSVEDDPLE